MKIKQIAAVVLTAAMVTAGGAAESADSYKVGWKVTFSLPDNQDSAGFDKNLWEAGGTKIGVAEPTYVVEKCTDSATGAVLTVSSVDATGALMCQPKVDLNKYPVMRWKWRAITLPKGADGRDPRKDDQAIVLYIGAKSFLKNKSISYRWETETPVGITGKASYGGGLVQVWYEVLQNKENHVGEWVVEERNVRDDFKKVYGYVPDEFALSIGTNSQYTGSSSKAQIEYIEFIAPEKSGN